MVNKSSGINKNHLFINFSEDGLHKRLNGTPQHTYCIHIQTQTETNCNVSLLVLQHLCTCT